MEAIDRLHTTAESHHRVLIVEVMGRHAGWIALHSGMPRRERHPHPERPFDIDKVCALVESRFATTTRRSSSREGATPLAGTVAVKEGELDSSGTPASRALQPAGRGDQGPHRPGVAGDRARSRAARRHADSLRPVAGDPVGLHAIDAVHDGDFGVMTALHGTAIERVPLRDAVRELKLVPESLYAEAEVFFG